MTFVVFVDAANDSSERCFPAFHRLQEMISKELSPGE